MNRLILCLLVTLIIACRIGETVCAGLDLLGKE